MTPPPNPNPCINCGYALIGLPPSGPCPECATPIELSRGEPVLSTASPAHILRLRRAITIILVTLPLQLALWLITFPFASQVSSTLNFSFPVFLIVAYALALALTILSSFGYWWFADPTIAHRAPGLAHRPVEPGHTAGTVLRFIVVARLASALLVFPASTDAPSNARHAHTTRAELAPLAACPISHTLALTHLTRRGSPLPPPPRLLPRCPSHPVHPVHPCSPPPSSSSPIWALSGPICG